MRVVPLAHPTQGHKPVLRQHSNSSCRICVQRSNYRDDTLLAFFAGFEGGGGLQNVRHVLGYGKKETVTSLEIIDTPLGS